MSQQKGLRRLRDFNSIALSIASPEDILSWSTGEVTKPETINYRTQKPEPDGLFCQRIFGPVRNWECACGKYKRVRYKGIVCEKCGVEVTRSVVRRERMGHIKLAVPVAHTWFLRSTPSKIGLLLDLPVKKLEQVVYFASYIVVEVDKKGQEQALVELESEYKKIIAQKKEDNALSLKTAKGEQKKGNLKEKDILALEEDIVRSLEEVNENFKTAKEEINKIEVGSVLTETEYRTISMKFGHVFRAGIGADAIREIIQAIDLNQYIEQTKEDIKNSSGQKQKKLIKRMKLAGSLQRSNMKPEWMIMTVIPVIPPDLRPMVQLDGGRFATSDLNDLYRRVINRNSRLKKLIQLGAPEIICRNEKRMLQESVDILISNSVRNSRAGMNYVQKRKLKSLSDMLKGKQGRFRQNLLGKRVDYSGRSVIVVGPTLNLDECGLPKYICMELFKPFVIAKLVEFELAYNVKSAEKLIKNGDKIVWDILDEVIHNKYVLLNRAPTLHRLGIQAFKPRLIEGKAIQIHPLVCTAYNADFDGDQMAVHLPLSELAQAEAREIMVSKNNLLKPASGDPVVNPSQDMVLGCYFLTNVLEGKKGEGMVFLNEKDAVYAYEADQVHLQASVKVRLTTGKIIDTTVGRIVFNRILPEGIEFKNELFGKKQLSKVLAECYRKCGTEATAKLADDIKNIGFDYATRSGVTVSAFDLKSPAKKDEIVHIANDLVTKINKLHWRGILTEEERYQNTIKIWHRVKSDITDELVQEYSKEDDIFFLIDSGARGNWGHVTQLAGMKGLVSNTSGGTIELPIRSNLKEGFTILEYFIATHAGRKGKTDTAMKTAEAGYLTRRLVDSVQDMVVRENDCKAEHFRLISRENSDEIGMSFEGRIFGRVLAEDVKKGSKTILKKGDIINEEKLEIVREHQVAEIQTRSVMYCQTLGGVCQQCYGYDLGNNKEIEIGSPVGIIAAQSIGEPGTQLTMRSFHTGGVAQEGVTMTQGLTRVEELLEARSPSAPAVVSEITGKVTVKKGKNDTKIIVKANKAQEEVFYLRGEFEADVKKGDQVRAKQIIARSTESKETIKSMSAGEVLKATGNEIIIKQSEAQERTYSVPPRLTLKVKDEEEITKGTPLTIGHLDLRQYMDLTSIEKVQEYILNEVQQIYSSQGQSINEKHIEIIVKQMISKVRIIDGGDSGWLPGEVKDLVELQHKNEALKKEKKNIVSGERLLLGLTRISLWTDSWLSAASFQETIRVLVEAAVSRKIDTLDGLKENVIIGRLIPAGREYKERLLTEQAEKKKK